MKPIEVIVPEKSMLNPAQPAAVVAGNVEVSTCVTNAIYGALGIVAGSQPTMNNFTFGDASRQYYETIAGGGGAGLSGRGKDAGFDGCSVVQTHMTNSRMTDPEVLEFRYPVRLERFEIRAGSGGAGRSRDGGRRHLRHPHPGRGRVRPGVVTARPARPHQEVGDRQVPRRQARRRHPCTTQAARIHCGGQHTGECHEHREYSEHG